MLAYSLTKMEGPFSKSLLYAVRESKKRTYKKDLNDRANVIDALVFLYHTCLASERMLIEAGESARYFKATDPFSEVLEEYYLRHFEEEKDEVGVLVEDLRNAGVDLKEVKADYVAIGMIGSQYYLMKHANPVCLLGYLAIQEADPTPIKLVRHLEKLHGKELLRFIRMHAVKDLEHRKELLELLDKVPAEKRGLVIMSVDNAFTYLKLKFGS